MNEKGGIDGLIFFKYLETVVMPLFPDAQDKLGKKVLLKLDSRPRRTNIEMLATLWLSGFYLYPCMPNTMSVSQETVQNYGLFKSIYRENLDTMTKAQDASGKPIKIPIHMIGLLVFGGKNCINKEDTVLKNAFAESF